MSSTNQPKSQKQMKRERERQKRKDKQKSRRQIRRLYGQNTDKTMQSFDQMLNNYSPAVCPICLDDEIEADDLIVYPCLCTGGYHFTCLVLALMQPIYSRDGNKCKQCRQRLRHELVIEHFRDTFGHYRQLHSPIDAKCKLLALAVAFYGFMYYFLVNEQALSTVPRGVRKAMELTVPFMIGFLGQDMARQLFQYCRNFFEWRRLNETELLPELEFRDYNPLSRKYDPGVSTRHDPVPGAQYDRDREHLRDLHEAANNIYARLMEQLQVLNESDRQQVDQFNNYLRNYVAILDNQYELQQQRPELANDPYAMNQ